jgi:hypothetical protein
VDSQLTLLHLVGEQPMPVLLPDRLLRPARSLLIYTTRTRPVAERLKRLLPQAAFAEADPYDLPAILSRLAELTPASEPTVVNLTGGTKMMMLAAFALAMQRGWDFVYLESEQQPATLHRYSVGAAGLRRQARDRLPSLISAADYLNAHLPGFRVEGFSRDEQGRLNDGGLFEQAVHDALRPHVDEVLAGVRPQGVANQIEIDLLIRVGNQVGVAEVKLGGGVERPKQGIDQLSTAASRDYLGHYTGKFLITANRLAASIQRLAREKQVTAVTLQEYRLGQPLTAADQQRLVQAVTERLTK